MLKNHLILKLYGSTRGYTPISSVQFSHSVESDSATPWIAARQASLFITNSRSLPTLMCIESVIPSSHLILCHPLLLPPPIPPSSRVFSNESTLRMRWPKYCSFSFGISPSKLTVHTGKFSWEVKLAWGAFHSSTSQVFYLGKVSSKGRFNLERFSSGGRNLQPCISSPCVLSFVIHLLWLSFLAFL